MRNLHLVLAATAIIATCSNGYGAEVRIWDKDVLTEVEKGSSKPLPFIKIAKVAGLTHFSSCTVKAGDVFVLGSISGVFKTDECDAIGDSRGYNSKAVEKAEEVYAGKSLGTRPGRGSWRVAKAVGNGIGAILMGALTTVDFATPLVLITGPGTGVFTYYSVKFSKSANQDFTDKSISSETFEMLSRYLDRTDITVGSFFAEKGQLGRMEDALFLFVQKI